MDEPLPPHRKLARLFSETIGDLRGKALVVVLGCLVCQMGLAFGYLFSALARDILGDTGWSRSDYAFARIPQLFVMAAASPIIGTLTIRIGARRVVSSAIVLLGITLLGMSRLEGLYAYYGWMMLLGVGLTGIGDITVGQVASQWVEKSRGLALALVYIGGNVGAVVLVPIASAIATRTSWRDALLCSAGVAFFVMLPAGLLLVRDRPRIVSPDALRAAAAEGGAHAAGDSHDDRDLDVWRAMRTRSFWILGFSLFTFFFYFLAMLEHIVLFLTDIGIAKSEAVAMFATAIGLGIWSKLGLGLIADRVPEKVSLMLDYGLLTVSSLLVFGLPGSGLTWAFVACFGVSYAARDVVYPLIVTRCFGLRYMAQIYGALMTTLFLGSSGAWLAARVHDETGSYTGAFVLFAALNGVSVIALTFVRDERAAARAAP